MGKLSNTIFKMMIINECFLVVESTLTRHAIPLARTAPSIMQQSLSDTELKTALITGLYVIHGALGGVTTVTTEFSAELICATLSIGRHTSMFFELIFI